MGAVPNVAYFSREYKDVICKEEIINACFFVSVSAHLIHHNYGPSLCVPCEYGPSLCVHLLSVLDYKRQKNGIQAILSSGLMIIKKEKGCPMGSSYGFQFLNEPALFFSFSFLLKKVPKVVANCDTQ